MSERDIFQLRRKRDNLLFLLIITYLSIVAVTIFIWQRNTPSIDLDGKMRYINNSNSQIADLLPYICTTVILGITFFFIFFLLKYVRPLNKKMKMK